MEMDKSRRTGRYELECLDKGLHLQATVVPKT